MIWRYHPQITTAPVNPHTVRLQFLQRGRRFALPASDGLMALVFAAAALGVFPPEIRDELFFVLIVEGGFLMAQGTLVDIATRLRKRPPVWAAALIVVAVVLFSNYTLDVIRMAWQQGSLVFVPLLISIAERGTILWRMPDRPQIEKIAARALIANRIVTGLGLFGLVTITMVIGVAFPELYDFSNAGPVPGLVAGAIYFAIAAFDDWRVRRPKFAARPRVLFGWDVIGIDYLAPV
ncbi:MAG TPA: hypothetical protein VF432_00105 [Thermoanaerobaculia bacterium]